MINRTFKPKSIYNLHSQEDFNKCHIIGGNPSGIINFNDTNHQWALNTYKLMEANQWFPAEANVGQDKHPYKQLSDDYRNMYDLALSQLITNDSIQTNQLVDSINRYITSPAVNACLVLQAYQEANHSKSYAVMVDEVCDDSNRIYNMHKHSPELARKNQAVATMYSSINSGDNPTLDQLQLAFAANQILEQLVFPGGFVALWSLGKQMTGTAKMIQFIQRDEVSHVAIFRNIFRESVSEYGLSETTKLRILELVNTMTEAEMRWTKSLTKGLLGFSDESIEKYIKFQANKVCDNLNINRLFTEVQDAGPLQHIEDSYSIVSGSKKKTNFFETAVSTYSINSIDDDY